MPETIHDEDDHQDIEAKSARWIRIHIYTYREGNSSDHFACRSNLQIKQASYCISRVQHAACPFWAECFPRRAEFAGIPLHDRAAGAWHLCTVLGGIDYAIPLAVIETGAESVGSDSVGETHNKRRSGKRMRGQICAGMVFALYFFVGLTRPLSALHSDLSREARADLVGKIVLAETQ